ncbi:unnamed protein product [Paramecium pentaurelia]|uniref:WD40-repeat-containing domain n=1 Tax=Paramecium pentaurelia TaxID=43138 RepID=A0A8S1YHU6_9CILI|nr:unnamed protein product [Paramecium pentaurelia]
MQIRCTQADHRNQQILGICIDSVCPNQRPYCNFCLPRHNQHLEKLTSFELLSEWIKERILQVQIIQNSVYECKIALDRLINLFIPYNNLAVSQFPELGVSQIDQLIKGLCLQDCEKQLFKQMKESIEQIKSTVNEILKKIKNQTNVKQDDNVQNPNLIFQQPKHQPELKPNLNPFTFEIMNQNSIKQNERCYAIAFNNDCSMVIAGCHKNIKVFQNIQGKLDQIQILSEHKDYVNTLNFMKNTNNFVSGSDDKSIIIWQEIGNSQWKCQQILNGHSHFIYCLQLNNTDDLIISGSNDKTIKFWMKQDKWMCQQTITDHTSYVYSLSLNDQQNKLISCSWDSQILVIEQQKLDNKWNVTQKIIVDKWGLRLCFISDNQFIFQPRCQEYIDIYEMDINTKQYSKTKQIAVKCGLRDENIFFPQQYLKSKCILVNKNGSNVNLMRKKENDDFIIQQSIEFSTYLIFGQLSHDGEYLITWDNTSKEIQIRKFRQL